MKHFILKLLLFFSIIVALVMIGLLLPATPHFKTSLLFAKIAKDKLLQTTPGPRLIFIGGSNLSMSLNSQKIKDELHINPINTAIMVDIGLAYMINDSLKYIKVGDIVVVSPEYSHFYNNNFYGGQALLWTVLGVSPASLKNLNWRQGLNIFRYLPKYAFSKFNPYEYRVSYGYNRVYLKDTYNEYGDSSHSALIRKNFLALEQVDTEEKFNDVALTDLIIYRQKIVAKGATLYLTFPGIQDKTFNNIEKIIKKVENELRKNNFIIIGTPERYIMPDRLMFDSPYHLNQEGVDYRTGLLIEDLKPYLNKYALLSTSDFWHFLL